MPRSVIHFLCQAACARKNKSITTNDNGQAIDYCGNAIYSPPRHGMSLQALQSDRLSPALNPAPFEDRTPGTPLKGPEANSLALGIRAHVPGAPRLLSLVVKSQKQASRPWEELWQSIKDIHGAYTMSGGK
jgi:hypothetical protein